MTSGRQIAICRTYDDLRRALRAFCAGQGVTRQQLDVDAGLADGQAGKILGPGAVSALGRVSLGRVLDALDLEIVLQIRADAPVRHLCANDASEDASEEKPARQDWRRKRGTGWARRMAARRALLLTPEERSASARTAAQARWKRPPGT